MKGYSGTGVLTNDFSWCVTNSRFVFISIVLPISAVSKYKIRNRFELYLQHIPVAL